MSIIIGIVVVSDRAAQGEYEDRGGPAVSAWLEGHVKSAFTTQTRIVPDEPDQLAAAIRALVDEAGCDLLLTTGGTGPAPRDITPESPSSAATGCCQALVKLCGRRRPPSYPPPCSRDRWLDTGAAVSS